MATECKHGKPVATMADLVAYSERPRCMERGDCDCHICDQICWEGPCTGKPVFVRVARRPGGEGDSHEG